MVKKWLDSIPSCSDNPAPFWCASLADMWEWLIHLPFLGFVAVLLLIGVVLYIVLWICVFIYGWIHPYG